MKRITSRANPSFRHLLKLAESARERRKQSRTLIDGVHLVESALGHGHAPCAVVIAESAQHKREITALIKRLPAAPLVLADELFEALTELKSSSGIIAEIVVPVPKQADPTGCWLLLEDIQDPGNLGSILRSGAAAGVSDAWLSKGCADAWSPKVLRSAMGAHFALSIHERADLLAAAHTFSGVVVATLPAAATPVFEASLAGAVAFTFGSEGAGLSEALRGAAGVHASIPMPGRAESLNVAAAAAVCLFERVRQLQIGRTNTDAG